MAWIQSEFNKTSQTDLQNRCQQSMREKSRTGDQGSSEKARWRGRFHTKLEPWEGTAVSDVGSKVFQTRGAWRENNRWPKPLSFHLAQERVFSSELELRVRDGVCRETQDDSYGGRVPSLKRKGRLLFWKVSFLWLGATEAFWEVV